MRAPTCWPARSWSARAARRADRRRRRLAAGAARRRRAMSPSSRSAATAGASRPPAAIWTCCCCTASGVTRSSALADSLWYPIWDAGVGLDHSVRTVEQAVAVARERPEGGARPARRAPRRGRSGADAPSCTSRCSPTWRRDCPQAAAGAGRRGARSRAERCGRAGVPARARPQGVARRTAGRPRDAARSPRRGSPMRRTSGCGRRTRGCSTSAASCTGGPPRGDRPAGAAGAGAGRGRARSWPTPDELMRRVFDAGRDDRVRRPTTPAAGWRRVEAARRGGGAGASGRSAGRWPTASWRRTTRCIWPATPTRRPTRCWCCGWRRRRRRPACRSARYTLRRLAAESAPLPEPWPPAARDALVATLGAGRPAIAVFEALDQAGLLVRLIPEWAAVRCKPQHNAVHRFTVDRHLIEAAVEASALHPPGGAARPAAARRAAARHRQGLSRRPHRRGRRDRPARSRRRLGLSRADVDARHRAGAAPPAAA